MQILESEWLGERLEALPDEDLFPLLDVGSSTLDYRTRIQPYVEQNIFAPLQRRGGRVWHADIKAAPGIDLVGDLLDPGFVVRCKELGVRSAAVFNVLHHVPDWRSLATAVERIVPSMGYIFVSGPHRFPRQLDPIDTMFRPDLEQVAALFPAADVVDGAILDSGNWRQWKRAERGNRSLPRALARLATPFDRPAKWWEVLQQSPSLIKPIPAFVVVLRKR